MMVEDGFEYFYSDMHIAEGNWIVHFLNLFIIYLSYFEALITCQLQIY